MDQAGKARAQVLLVAQAPFLHGAGLEVFGQHVGAFEQAQQDLAAGGLADVERDRLLVAVDADEVAGVRLVAERRAPVAHLVALRRLDLDHLGAVVGQDHRAVGTAEHAGQVDDLDAGERTRGYGEALSAVLRLDRSVHPALSHQAGGI